MGLDNCLWIVIFVLNEVRNVADIFILCLTKRVRAVRFSLSDVLNCREVSFLLFWIQFHRWLKSHRLLEAVQVNLRDSSTLSSFKIQLQKIFIAIFDIKLTIRRMVWWSRLRYILSRMSCLRHCSFLGHSETLNEGWCCSVLHVLMRRSFFV